MAMLFEDCTTSLTELALDWPLDRNGPTPNLQLSNRASVMAYARYISIVMTVLGLVLIGVSIIGGLHPLVTITGMLLVVAGIVKIAMVAIWKSFFSIPIEPPAPSENPPSRGVRKGKV